MTKFNPLAHPICLRQPYRLAESAWIPHVPFAMFLVDAVRPRLLVELGTHRGVSYCSFCQAARELNLEANFYAVDTWEGDAQTGFYGAEVLDELKGYHDLLYGGFSRLIKSTFDDASERFSDGSIDLLHIDGTHQYNAVKHDFDTWLPKLSDRAVVLLHDTNVREGEFGVWKLWRDIKKDFACFELVHGHGLGMLCVGEEQPEVIEQLTSLKGSELQEAREFFFQIGTRWEREFGFRSLASGIAQQEALRRELESELEDKQNAIEKLERLREGDAERIEQLKQASSYETRALRQEIQGLSARTNMLEAEVAARTDELQGLRHENSEAEVLLKRVRSERDSAESALLTARHEIEYIIRTRSWRLIAAWWQLRNRLFPLGSARLRLYHLARTSIDILLSGGPGALLKKVITWAQGDRDYYPTGKYKTDPGGGTRESSGLERTVEEGDVSGTRNRGQAYGTEPRILYIVSRTESVSKKYRVFDVCERLRSLGVQVQVAHDLELGEPSEIVSPFDVIVFTRLPMTPINRAIVDAARTKGKVTAFEVDDYVFDLNILNYVDALHSFSKAEYEEYADGVRMYRQLLEYCDCAIVSTDFLARRVEEIGKRAFVIPNGLNAEQLELAEKALRNQSESLDSDERVRIGYLSGTNTHRADFEVAVPALMRILDEFPEVILCLRGHLRVPDELEIHSDRIEPQEFVPWRDLIEATSRLDIAIAPLEPGNPYTSAKSALKYFEPSLVEVPVVASRNEAYSNAIDHGTTGFLASNEEEWYLALKQLVRDASLREQIGRAARKDALENYTVDALSERTLKAFQTLTLEFKRETPRAILSERSLTMTWVTSSPFPGSGGHRSIIRTAELLRRRGHHVILHLIDDGQFGSGEHGAAFIDKHFMEHNIDVRIGTENLTRTDAMIATTWQSAVKVHENRNMARCSYYFVQDFEPYFHQMGNDYVRAEQTYKLGLKHITIGPWLAKKLREEYQAEADYFQFPISHDVYNPDVSPLMTPGADAKRVIFFARPDMPRRCYPLGLDSLEVVANRAPDTELVFFGSNNLVSRSIPFNHINLGILNDVNKLAAMHASGTVGLVFSTTNPSLMPLEMMACGCPVVEMDNEINRVHFGESQPALLVEPDPSAVADGILQLLEDRKLRRERAEKGISFVANFPTLDETITRVERIIIEGIEQ